jgi:predicted DNA-binding protein
MSKEVQMSIKMEAELRDEFMAVAAMRHRPAAQIIRELMRLYIAQSHKAENVLAATIPSAILD